MPDLFDIELPYFDVSSLSKESLKSLYEEPEFGPCHPAHETYFPQGDLQLKGEDVKFERLVN
ncbi:MAG: hypothetical protein AABW91_00990 [Nanoarchaeota archaeon]